MATSTFVYFKELNTDTTVMAELGSLIDTGETISSYSVTGVTPTTTIPLNASITSSNSIQMTVLLTGGNKNISYGVEILVTTNKKVFTVLLAVLVSDANSQLIPYVTSNPDAFKDLLGDLQPGESAIGTAVFSYPADVDPSGGYVFWEILAEDGTVFNAGNCFDYKVQSTGLANNVIARAVISVPTDIIETIEGQKYQIRWTIHYSDVTEYQFENLNILSGTSIPLGSASVIEMQGDPATSELVSDELFDRAGIILYQQNKALTPLVMISDTSQPVSNPPPVKVQGGWFYAAVVDTTNLAVSVYPYTCVWKYWQSKYANRIYSERADFWVVNPSLMSAIDDVKAKINKARTTLYGKPDLLFPPDTIMTWLRRAADAFNGYQGLFTSFNFSNAVGGVREYWLMFAEMYAIESQYLAEGEKAFDFQGAAIQLTIDKTQYLDNIAGKLQSRIDSELKPFKQNLIIKGNTGGDGSGDATISNPAALGTVGITITPASLWGRFVPGYPRIR